MNKQPEALRLAELLTVQSKVQFDIAHDQDCRPRDTANWKYMVELGAAVSELRAQHDTIEAQAAEIERLRGIAPEQPASTKTVTVPLTMAEDMRRTVDAIHKEVDVGWSHDAVTNLIRLQTTIYMMNPTDAATAGREGA
jgi:hypothetical protein